jgi:hypothetical protein
VNTCGGIFYSFIPEKMPNYIDPKSLGLQPRIVVEDIDGNTLAIVINRKSRIIMADGRKILALVKKIKKAKPGCKVMLKTVAPICSKTLQYLAEHGIGVIIS